MIIEFWKTGDNPITCYSISKQNDVERIPNKILKGRKVSVTVVCPKGKKSEYESVKKAAEAVAVPAQFLYDYLNGRCNNSTEYLIYKSQINN